MADTVLDYRNAPDFSTATLKIGEFLKLVEVLSPQALNDTLVTASELKVPIGRAAVLRGLITNAELSSLVQLHCLVRCDAISIEDARNAFSMARRVGWPVRECLIALGCPLDDATTVRLGELLIEAECISDQDLDMSLELQKLCGLPLGRILAIDACVPELVIKEALHLQSEIRQRKRNYRDAVSRLRRLRISNEDLEARRRLLLNRFGAADGTIDFSELLLAAHIIREDELTKIKEIAASKQVLPADLLRSYEWIDKELLSVVAGLYGLIRDGYVSPHEAVAILKKLRRSDTETLDDLPAVGALNTYHKNAVSLYQFLVTSGFLSPEGIRELIRNLMADANLFQQITGIACDVTSDQRYMKSAIIKTIVDSRNLEKALLLTRQFDGQLINYARDLLTLVSLDIINIDQAILSFSRLRCLKSAGGA